MDEIIGLGIYLTSGELQNNDFKFITSIMDDVSLSISSKSMTDFKKGFNRFNFKSQKLC